MNGRPTTQADASQLEQLRAALAQLQARSSGVEEQIAELTTSRDAAAADLAKHRWVSVGSVGFVCLLACLFGWLVGWCVSGHGGWSGCCRTAL